MGFKFRYGAYVEPEKAWSATDFRAHPAAACSVRRMTVYAAAQETGQEDG